MCGIAGWSENIDFKKTSKILKILKPRGPDAVGEWSSEDKKIWLGHTRLKILDLSDNSNQPMVSKCNRYVLSFNGEIYNYQKIRKKLLIDYSISFRGYSDTEVLLALIETYGFYKAINLFEINLNNELISVICLFFSIIFGCFFHTLIEKNLK